MLATRRVLIVRGVRQAGGDVRRHALQRVSRRSGVRRFRPHAGISAAFRRALRITAVRLRDGFAVVGTQGGKTVRRGRHDALQCIAGIGGVVSESDPRRNQASPRKSRRCRHEHETPKSAFHSGRCPVSASSFYKLAFKATSKSLPCQLPSRFRRQRDLLKSLHRRRVPVCAPPNAVRFETIQNLRQTARQV